MFLDSAKIFTSTLLLLILISSCANIDSNRVAPGYVQAFTAIKQLIVGYEDSIDPQVIENIPYASMLVRIGKGPAALMILESIDNDNYTWVSADGVYLILNGGRIIKTHGLTNNLHEKLMPKSNKWSDDIYTDQKFISYYSFRTPDLNNLKVTSTYLRQSAQNIDLTFGNKKLFLIEENIISEAIGWKSTNRYWADENHFIWKSVQSISPRLPEIHIEVTKKPR